MSMSVGCAVMNNMLLHDWSEQTANRGQTPRNKGMALYYKAVRDCDKAMETVMDKHHESVAKSAEKMKEYRSKKAREDAVRKAADDRRRMNEEAAVRAVDYREFMQELRLSDENRRAAFQMVF